MSIKVRILFLSANPVDTSRLRVDKEQREIDQELRMSRSRDSFEFIDAEAVRSHDLQQVLLDNEPRIVHFSGHGTLEGVILEDEDGNAVPVSTIALANLFRLFKDQVQCVVLNACFSEAQANAIVEHVPYVIGMSHEMPDDAALRFSTGFYKAIGAGKNIDFAFELGVNAIELDGLESHTIPRLLRSEKGGVYTPPGTEEKEQAIESSKLDASTKLSPNNTATNTSFSLSNLPYIFGINSGILGVGAIVLIAVMVGIFKMCGTKTIANNVNPPAPLVDTIKPTTIPSEKGQAIRTQISETITLEKGVYTITAPTHILYQGKLILKPGAVVKFAQDASLTIDRGGILEAKGTAKEPIVFCGQSNTEGFWQGIAVLSNTKQNMMEYVQILDAGHQTTAALQIGASDGTVGRLSFKNSSIKNCTSSGMIVHESSTVDDLEKNTITHCDAFPIILFQGNMDLVKAAAENKFTGNKRDMVAIQGLYDAYTRKPMTLEKLSIPYCINATERSKVIYIGSKVTINPGAHIIMSSEAGIRVDGLDSQKGSLIAIGTPNEPIVFEGQEHSKGSWDAIYLLSDNNNLQYCKISDGGRTQHCCGGGNDKASGMITIGDYYMNIKASATIQNCTLSNSNEGAIYYKKAFVRVNQDIVSSNTFIDNTDGNVIVK